MASPVSLLPKVLPLVDGRSVLDIGCGDGLYGYALRTCWWQTISGSKEPDWVTRPNPKRESPGLLVGLDVDPRVLVKPVRHRIYDLAIVASAHRLPFPDHSFDTVLCVEIIEHLTKAQANQLLDEVERVARLRIVITTPRHPFREPGPYAELSDEVRFSIPNSHKSMTRIAEFEARGYSIGSLPPTCRNPLHRVGRELYRMYHRHIFGTLIAIKVMKTL